MKLYSLADASKKAKITRWHFLKFMSSLHLLPAKTVWRNPHKALSTIRDHYYSADQINKVVKCFRAEYKRIRDEREVHAQAER